MSEDKIELTIRLPKNLYKFYHNFNSWAKVYYDTQAFIENMAIDFLTDHAEDLVHNPRIESDPEEILRTYNISRGNKKCDVCGESVFDLTIHKAKEHRESITLKEL